MSADLVPAGPRERRFRKEIPQQHRGTLDTRLVWLWNQRAGTVQAVWEQSPDVLDRTAATMVLQALFGKDLNAIALLFSRLEGGAVDDVTVADQALRI